MAADTGGQFYTSDTPDNLRTTYQQLAEILFENQYVLDYVSALGVGVTADLRIEASLSQNTLGDDTKEITPCP
jgi:hypothetical protein